MAEIELTQAEADVLLACEKHRADEELYMFPQPGEHRAIPLRSADTRESFLLDILRGRIKLSKITYQNRARNVVVLARLDVDGPLHTNPDGTDVPCPHLHLYREGFGDKWALPAPMSHFHNPSDLWQTYQDFLTYCNVTQPPHVQHALF